MGICPTIARVLAEGLYNMTILLKVLKQYG